VPISIIPTAAAVDNNHRRAGNNGVNWFRSLGATHVEALPIIDKASANDTAIATCIRQSHLIYLLGGSPSYLGGILANSASYHAMLAAYEAGAVLAGSSAGAMVLCQYYFDLARRRIVEGLNFVPNTCVLPHHNTFGKDWASALAQLLPHAVLLGIDERTGMLDDDAGRKTGWRVYGQGAVTVYRSGKPTIYTAGQTFKDSFLSNEP
jgi:cyanophycinase